MLVWFSVICKSFFDKINEKAIYQSPFWKEWEFYENVTWDKLPTTKAKLETLKIITSQEQNYSFTNDF